MQFNQAIRTLQTMIKNGKHGSAEYNALVVEAQKLNPNPYTPIGFYLDGPRPYTRPNGKPVYD